MATPTVKELPSQELLRKLMDYDPDTGVLTWRPRTPDMFEGKERRSAESICAGWNKRFAGKGIGSFSRGYLTAVLDYKLFMVHRLIWKLHYGSDPDEIDHEDGDRLNNRIANLRDVSRLENTHNRKRPSVNKSGVVGVRWVPQFNKWICTIGTRQHVGLFDNFEDAVAARKAAEEKLGYHPNHGRQI